MSKISARKHYVQMMFILVVFILFTFSGVSALLLSINAYRGIVESGDATSDYRNRVSYIREVLRQHDYDDRVRVSKVDGSDVIEIDISDDYVKYIYVSDGYLRELLTKKGADVSLSAGEKLIEATELNITEQQGAYDIVLTGADGASYSSTVALKSGGRYEEQ